MLADQAEPREASQHENLGQDQKTEHVLGCASIGNLKEIGCGFEKQRRGKMGDNAFRDSLIIM